MDEYALHKQFKRILTGIIETTDQLLNDKRVNDRYDPDSADLDLHAKVQGVKKGIQDIFTLDRDLLKYNMQEEEALKSIQNAVSKKQVEEFAKHHYFNRRIDHHATQLDSYLTSLLKKSSTRKLKTILFNVLQNAAAFRVLVNHELTLDDRLQEHFKVIKDIAEKYEKLL
jgi:hypothetical protein